MKYKNPDYLARQVRARRGASALGKLAGWNLANYSELIPPALQEYGYDPTADVFVIPWSGRALAPIMAALREVRSTAVLVMPGMTTIGTPTYYFSVIGWTKGEVCRHDQLRLWSLDERSFWLSSDFDGGSSHGCGYELASAPLHPAMSPPWRDEHEHGFGFGCADILLMKMDAL